MVTSVPGLKPCAVIRQLSPGYMKLGTAVTLGGVVVVVVAAAVVVVVLDEVVGVVDVEVDVVVVVGGATTENVTGV